jgi:hypothetical protein
LVSLVWTQLFWIAHNHTTNQPNNHINKQSIDFQENLIVFIFVGTWFESLASKFRVLFFSVLKDDDTEDQIKCDVFLLFQMSIRIIYYYLMMMVLKYTDNQIQQQPQFSKRYRGGNWFSFGINAVWLGVRKSDCE